MKHQIILLGKDITSVYHGIKEFNPDCVHFLHTEATREVTVPMLPLLSPGIRKYDYLTAPYDGNKVMETCRSIHEKYKEDEFVYHLSEGTKPMALAAFRVAGERGARCFYLTQSGELVWLDSFEIISLRSSLENEEIIRLSGNILSDYHDIKKLREEDIHTAEQIERFIEHYPHEHARIMKFFGVICRREISRLPQSKLLPNELRFKIINRGLLFTRKGHILLRSNNPNALNLYFKGSWWETLVANQVRMWSERQHNPPEAWRNVLFRTHSGDTQAKNEIDVLVNHRQNLIFIECKSGQVTQNDIYKIDGVRETYGGDISRAVLASYYPLDSNLREKCNDLQIHVFAPACLEERAAHLMQLPEWLNRLDCELQL